MKFAIYFILVVFIQIQPDFLTEKGLFSVEQRKYRGA